MIETSADSSMFPLFRMTLSGPFTLSRRVGESYISLEPTEWENRIHVPMLLHVLSCAEKRQASRNQLICALWPTANSDNKEKALRNVLSLARKVLTIPSHECLLSSKKNGVGIWHYQLSSQSVLWIDVDDFLQLLHQAELVRNNRQNPLHLLEQALACLQGEFLPNYTSSDWAWIYREYLEKKLHRCLLDLAHCYQQQEQGKERAVPLLKRVLERDPYNDQAAIALLELLVLLGQRHEAIRQGRALLKCYEQDDLPPSEQFLHVYAIITKQYLQRSPVLSVYEELHDGDPKGNDTMVNGNRDSNKKKRVNEQRRALCLTGLSFLADTTKHVVDEEITRVLSVIGGTTSVDTSTLKSLQSIQDQHWRLLYSEIPWPLLLRECCAHLELLDSLLKSTHQQHHWESIAKLACQQSQIVAEILFDLQYYDQAERTYDFADALARQLHDKALLAVALARHNIRPDGSNLKNILSLYQEADLIVKKTGGMSETSRAWVSVRCAEAYAKMGNALECQHSLARAETIQAEILDQDPHQTHFSRVSYLAYQGTCLNRIGRADVAEGILKAAIVDMPEWRATLYKELTTSYVLQGQMEAACNAAHQGLTFASKRHSRTTLEHYAALLAPYASSQDVWNVQQRIAELRRSLSSPFSD